MVDAVEDIQPQDTQASPARRSRSRRLARWVIGSLAALALLLVAAFALLNSPIGKRFIADQIAQVAPASGLRFEVGRIEGDLFGQAVLHDVVLLDPEGKFLTIPVVELDWRPLSWITKGLDIRNLTARRGTLLRMPELLPGDPDAPILPDFDIRIDRFVIDNLTLAPGIAGDEAQRVNLTAQSDIRDGRVFLKADGRLGRRDRIFALIDAEPDGDKFDIEMQYIAPQDGVLAGMLGADAPYSGVITGDGTWRSWTGALLVRRAEDRAAAFMITNRAGNYTISGQAYPAPWLTGLPANALGEAVGLIAKGTLEDSVLDGKMWVFGRAVEATAAGVVDLAGNAFETLEVGARLTDPALLGPDLRLEGASLAATLDGPFRDLAIPHELSIERFVSGGTVITGITQQGTATYDGTRWVLPLSAEVARVATGTALIDPRLVNGRLNGTVVYSGNRVLSDDLAIDFADLTARLALQGDVARGAYALVGPVNVTGLALENVGNVSGTARILLTLPPSAPWTLAADFDGHIPNVTNDTLANLAGNAIAFRGGVTLGGASTGGLTPLEFRNVVIGASKLSLRLNGRVSDGTTTLAGSGNHTQYGDFTVEAAVTDAGPEAVLVFASPLPAAGLTDVRVAIAPTEEGFAIETEGGSMLGPFAGQLGLYAPEGGPTRIAVETLTVWKTSVTGDITLSDAGASGALALSGGGLDGTIALSPRGGGQAFDVDIRARRASFGGETPISIARADIEATGLFRSSEDALETRSTITGNIYAEGISYGSLFVGKLAARADLTNGQGPITASLSGRRGGRFNLQMNANVARDRIDLVARGEFAGRRIGMPRRAVLTRLEDGGWRLAPSQLSFGRGFALAEGRFGGRGLTELEFKFANMPLSLVDIAVADFGLGGTISGVVDYRGQAGQLPVGSARLKIDNLSRSGLVLTSRPIDVLLVSRLTGRGMETRAVIDEGGERRGRMQARITDMPASGDLVARLEAGNLFAQLRFGGPADALWRLAAIETFDLTGPVSVAADVTGSLNNPRVRGSVSSDSLRMQSALSGTDVRDITVRGNFAGSLLRLTRFSGTAVNGGSVSGSGTVELGEVTTVGPKIDIRIAARNARLLDAAGLSATVTGPLRILSSGSGGTIAGRLEVNRAAWTLGTAASAEELPRIKTTQINTAADIAPTRARSRPWRYLIDARARSRVDVDGMGLDSEWSADIILRGTTSDPRIGGEANVIRGSYSFAGTRFELTEGEIDFDANVPIDPRLNIEAETSADGLDVTVRVQGSALKPEITFSSVPALPEEEILSRLLFGGSITELSATDALQLGAALASLRGGGGMDPINRLRTAIGLDRLRIVSADPALGRGTAVAVGKNIGRRFYVEIITDGGGYSATEVEFRVTSWLSLLASISTIGRESVSAEVSKDY
ncbi:translocation/assembly module TamB domain-containing protein [Allopontixanthobacter sp.]|uniref:translocation/assembly module TamB domain-containing protein n=1 Tax=Allopontixanthobacter sp. TaxID=2906452 RepID=UPI002AB98750|nr:translocation/assembly module TamB domain-containing protein [Allopontixanthobacter sp.]MDZ4306432.1 translocation/assembly module TamB domain-containing protein [Allopontixanthobacter sp.]